MGVKRREYFVVTENKDTRTTLFPVVFLSASGNTPANDVQHS